MKKIGILLLCLFFTFFSYGEESSLLTKLERNMIKKPLDLKLLEAVKKEDLKATKELLDKGADVNLATPGPSPLTIAVNLENEEMVKLLLRHGADPSLEYKFGESILGFALDTENKSIIKLIRKALQGQLQKLNEELFQAIEKEEVKKVGELLDYRANPNAQNSAGWTPLMLASVKENLDIPKLLLKKGADPNLSNKKGWTPLMSASKAGHVPIVKLLLEAGAEPRAQSETGWTASELSNNNDILKLLEKAIKKQACQKAFKN